jgi:hypothetical protein
MELVDQIKKKLIFLAGDIRREKCLGGFAWGKYPHKLEYDESILSVLYADEGYIGLHRNIGDLSNKGYPGFTKHAWLYTGGNYIVEAVSEGVLKRNHMYASHDTDYLIILKPLTSIDVRKEAVKRALYLAYLKMPYDDHFKFDLDVEESLFADKEIALENMRKFDLGFSCSELVSFCYVANRRVLGIYRTKFGSRQVVLPDAFISTHFEIVFASKETTPETAKKLGLCEEGVEQLSDYWRKVNENKIRRL